MNELYSYPSNDYRSYLAHHGVKGMKWGVRHDDRRKAMRASREARRKQRKMERYGITSEQYNAVRSNSLKRHKSGEPWRYGITAGMSAAAIGRYLRNAGPEDNKLVGAAATAVIQSAITTGEWMVGRAIIDNLTENSEFRRMGTENAIKDMERMKK